MFDSNTHSVEHRIVSIHQPHVRPIVRGKAQAKVEFGSKIHVSIIDGISFLDELSWDAFNEGNHMMDYIQKYRKRFGCYPREVLADKIYCTRANRAVLKELGIRYVVAKAQSELHARVLMKIGADKIVSPEKDMGMRVAHNLISSNILDYIELSEEHSIIEYAVPESWIGKDLRDINMRLRYGVTVVAIRNINYEKVNISPKADNEIKEGDIMIVIGNNNDLKKLERKTE